MPSAVLRSPILWEVADIVEQIFRIACTENLYPRPEEYDAAACDYQAAHGLSYTAMCKQMNQYGALTEIHERAQVIALMRLYRAPLASLGFRGSACKTPFEAVQARVQETAAEVHHNLEGRKGASHWWGQ